MNWYCETYRCKMDKSACDKRKTIAAGQSSARSWHGRDFYDAGCGKCTKGVYMTEEIKKICKKCLVLKPLAEFPPNKECKDGTEGSCRECKLASQRENDRKKRALQLADKAMVEATKLEINNESGSPPIFDKDRFAKIGDKFRAAIGIENMKTYDIWTDNRGPKESAGKPDWSVFPFKESEEVVKVFEYGSKKYGAPFTYRRGIPPSELWSAIMRHMIAIQNGEQIDPESGCKHIAHVAANALMSLQEVA